MAPSLRVIWGAYFKPDPAEQLQAVQMVQAAFGGGATGGERLITTRLGVQKLASVFDIENVDATLDAIEEESNARAQQELDAATAQIAAQAGAAGPDKNAGGDAAKSGGGNGRPSGGKDNAKPKAFGA